MAKTPQQATQNISLSQPALEFLGLSQQPFTPSILSPDAIYNHAALTQLKDTVKHHLQFSNLMLVIEGNYGSGKTTFFRQLMQEQIPNTFLMPQQAEATDTLAQVQQKMSIHLKEQGDANQLDENLKNMQMFDQTPVLMIDDAHMLSDTTLQELIRYIKQLQVEQEITLKLLLFANKGMAATIKHVSDVQQSEMFVHDLPALSEKQIQSFIHHRLSNAGASNPLPVLDEKVVQNISSRTSGNPLQVMGLAVNSFEKMAKKQPTGNTLAIGKSARLLGLILALAAAGAAAYLFLFSGGESDALVSAPPRPKPVIAPQQPPVVAPPAQQTQPVEAEPEPMPVPEVIEPGTHTEPTTPEPTTDTLETPPEEPAEDSNLLPNMAPADPESMSEPTPPPEPARPETPPVPPAPAPAPVVKSGKQPGFNIQPSRQPAAESAAEPAPADPALSELTGLGLRDSQWLKQQNPNQWTLQILGARDPDTLIKFARQHRLGAETAWYRTDLKGLPWYVLVHRLYPTRDIARQAVGRLPVELQKGRPWVKSLSAVQKAIK